MKINVFIYFSFPRILQSYGATTQQSNNENVCVTVPPVISVTISKNPAGESHCDISVDYTRFNFSVSFLSELFKFILESIPHEEASSIAPEGCVNYGYVGENICVSKYCSTWCLIKSFLNFTTINADYRQKSEFMLLAINLSYFINY